MNSLRLSLKHSEEEILFALKQAKTIQEIKDMLTAHELIYEFNDGRLKGDFFLLEICQRNLERLANKYSLPKLTELVTYISRFTGGLEVEGSWKRKLARSVCEIFLDFYPDDFKGKYSEDLIDTALENMRSQLHKKNHSIKLLFNTTLEIEGLFYEALHQHWSEFFSDDKPKLKPIGMNNISLDDKGEKIRDKLPQLVYQEYKKQMTSAYILKNITPEELEELIEGLVKKYSKRK